MPPARRTLRLATLLATGLSVLALATGPALAAPPYRIPRLPWAAPDLEGDWTSFTRTPLERPEGVKTLTLSDAEATALEKSLNQRIIHPADDPFGQGEAEWYPDAKLARIDGQARTSWIVSPADGRVPYRPEARRLFDADRARQSHGFDNPDDRPPQEQCLIGTRGASGPPMLSALYPTNFQIVQTATAVAILSEVNHDVRIIRLTGPTCRRRSRPGWATPSAIGKTTRWWWRPPTSIHATTSMSSSRCRRTPRSLSASPAFRRPRFFMPSRWRTPASTRQSGAARLPVWASKDPIYEFACHEGNYSLSGILAGARQDEAKAAAGSAGGARPAR